MHADNKNRPFAGVVWVTLALTASLRPACAGVIDPDLDPMMFGHLVQGMTSCPLIGCGPTAAVNSFVFLQKEYPLTYGTTLVGSTEASEIQAADDLGGYMSTIGTGTNWENFIEGKQEYIDSKDPGSSNVTAISQYTWDPCIPSGQPSPCNPQDYINKPNGVTDNTVPTGVDIAGGLYDLFDVEILVGIYKPDPNNPGNLIRVSGHYVTVTGITVSAGSGTINFIDPNDGMNKTRAFTSPGGVLTWVSPTGSTIKLEAEFTEGPVSAPEPDLRPLLALCLIVACGIHILRSPVRANAR